MKLKRTTVFWTSLVSGIIVFIQQVTRLFGFEFSDEMVSELMLPVSTVLSLLVLVGVLTNSEEAENFESKVFKESSTEETTEDSTTEEKIE